MITAARFTAKLAALALLAIPHVAWSQTRTDWIGPEGAEASWTEGASGAGEGSNWQSVGGENFQPDRTFGGVGEYASISNGGIAMIDGADATPVSPAAIRLGEDGGSAGTLVIRNGGSIVVQEASGGQGDGRLANGGAGSGTLVLRDDLGSVSLQQYSQTASSTLVTQLGSAGSFGNPVQVSETIDVNGTLRVEATPSSGFTANTGDSWTIISGAPVSGEFDQILSDPSLLSNPGQAFAVSTANNAVTLSVEQRLVLEVDRFTGATRLMNPAGHSTDVSLINYTLSSGVTPLVSSDANWHSFTDDGAKAGWFEANPTAQNLSELNPEGELTLSSGDEHDFGTPLAADTSAPLGVNRVEVNNVSFNYQLPSGNYVSAAVVPVGRINDLVLVIDPDTGAGTIQNQSAQSLELISYTIGSDAGSLLPGFSGSGLSDWFVANPTATNLSELNTADPLLAGVGDEISLGTVWDTSAGFGDSLSFNYQTPDGSYLTGTVDFGELAEVPTTLVGDYNGDGEVDIADYTVWRNTLGATVAAGAGADGDGSGMIDAGDYQAWKTNFGTSLAASAIGNVSNQAVPEPTAVILALAALTGLSIVRQHQGGVRAAV
ncbi:hypothetical protein NG895_24760 [Aeoliella sp. ICT_H6.2]|uniref:PEP-CTERM protein-sorting domain-containing protein n=1 Tax=Aeoliella straminimaris TaxID=2954799 RepID=A0A9X2FFM2_9BACT|nr:hypothetical protein [Aeoliella straminimaris]MCO6047122.1 hypothetical protein [Aeoliella straminimaris]